MLTGYGLVTAVLVLAFGRLCDLHGRVCMLPLTLGFLVAGPVSGFLSDRHGARPFATGGMLIAAIVFLTLSQLPVLFAYPAFALLVCAMGWRSACSTPRRWLP